MDACHTRSGWGSSRAGIDPGWLPQASKQPSRAATRDYSVCQSRLKAKATTEVRPLASTGPAAALFTSRRWMRVSSPPLASTCPFGLNANADTAAPGLSNV